LSVYEEKVLDLFCDASVAKHHNVQHHSKDISVSVANPWQGLYSFKGTVGLDCFLAFTERRKRILLKRFVLFEGKTFWGMFYSFKSVEGEYL
jgi:hypothetical protein